MGSAVSAPRWPKLPPMKGVRTRTLRTGRLKMAASSRRARWANWHCDHTFRRPAASTQAMAAAVSWVQCSCLGVRNVPRTTRCEVAQRLVDVALGEGVVQVLRHVALVLGQVADAGRAGQHRRLGVEDEGEFLPVDAQEAQRPLGGVFVDSGHGSDGVAEVPRPAVDDRLLGRHPVPGDQRHVLHAPVEGVPVAQVVGRQHSQYARQREGQPRYRSNGRPRGGTGCGAPSPPACRPSVCRRRTWLRRSLWPGRLAARFGCRRRPASGASRSWPAPFGRDGAERADNARAVGRRGGSLGSADGRRPGGQ